MSSRLRILSDQSEKPPIAPVNRDASIGIASYQGKVAIVTLGCAKNQIDSEVMLGSFAAEGFEVVSDVSEADVVVINTCGFLQSSVEESIDAVLDVAQLKEEGRLRHLMVAGCLVERYGDELEEELPEVDSFVTTDDLLLVGKVATRGEVGRALDSAARPYFLYDDSMPRLLSSAPHTAYVKISEGCDRGCSFCIIPRIRGEMRSRDIDSVVREFQNLAGSGVKEVNLVAQDLTAFGRDRGEFELERLLDRLDREGGVPWIRLLYAYPIGVTESLLRKIVELPSVCEYLDLPLQHSADSILKQMGRPVGKYASRRLVEFIRSTAPEIALRTTFIVGFPGEREEDISELVDFVGEGYFSSVGVFTYSPEIGTPAQKLGQQVSDQEKEERRERVMLAQQKVVERSLKSYIGREIPVILEGAHEDTDLLLSGRARFQAPEVDGTVIVNEVEGFPSTEPGAIQRVEITEVAGYDLVARLMNSEARSPHN